MTSFPVKISRDGKEIGTFEAKEAIGLLAYGTLKPTDFYWHDGMSNWAPLSQLQAALDKGLQLEADRRAKKLEEERLLREKQEQKLKAERLAQEKAKAREEEDRAVAEATRVRLEQEKANRFRCQCCRESFVKPKDPADDFIPAIVGLVVSGLITLIPILGWVLGPILGIYCACIILASQLVPPFCPFCRSSNFCKPEKPDEQK